MLKKKKNEKKIKGYCFVVLTSKIEFDKMLKEETHELEGRILIIKPYLKGEELEKFREEVENRRVFIKEIPLEFEDKDLLPLLKQFGSLEDCFIARDIVNGGKSRGFGYGTFHFVEDARKAFEIGFVEYSKNEGENGRIEIFRFEKKGKRLGKIEVLQEEEEDQSHKDNRGFGISNESFVKPPQTNANAAIGIEKFNLFGNSRGFSKKSLLEKNSYSVAIFSERGPKRENYKNRRKIENSNKKILISKSKDLDDFGFNHSPDNLRINRYLDDRRSFFQ